MLVKEYQLSVMQSEYVWRLNVQYGDYNLQYCSVYLKFAYRVDLKCLHTHTQMVKQIKPTVA